MRRPFADKRPIGPFLQRGSSEDMQRGVSEDMQRGVSEDLQRGSTIPRGTINELQFNFRFDIFGEDSIQDMEDIVVQNSPDTPRIRETLVAPDVKGEAISITTGNQIIYEDLEAWKDRVVDELSQMDSTSTLKELVIIGT